MLAAALIAACGATTEQPPQQPEAPSSQAAEKTQPAEESPTKAPKPAPNVPAELKFSAKTLDGKPFAGQSLAGKPAMLWFWTPWCPKCNAEAPGIAKAAKTYGDRVTFVGVAANDTVSAMQDFVGKYGTDSFTNLNDERAAVWAKFGVTYQPAYAFIAADGQVEVVKDQMSAEDLNSRLEKLAG